MDTPADAKPWLSDPNIGDDAASAEASCAPAKVRRNRASFAGATQRSARESTISNSENHAPRRFPTGEALTRNRLN